MESRLFPLGSFCIELTDEQGGRMLKLLEKKKITFTYIYDGENTGGVVNSTPDKKPQVVLQLSDTGKNWLASIDHLKKSKDEVFVRLITPDNPDVGKPMPEFKDVFKVFEATDENLKKWKGGKIEDI